MNEELTQNLRKQLSKKEQVILADMWENPEIRPALVNMLGKKQLQIAQMVLKSSADHYWTVEQRGEANGLKWVTDFLSSNLKASNNERKR